MHTHTDTDTEPRHQWTDTHGDGDGGTRGGEVERSRAKTVEEVVRTGPGGTKDSYKTI